MAENKLGSVLKPFTTLKTLGERPDTIRVPFETRPASERYRGFHINDLEECIGCGTCAEICDNDAIRMVPVEGKEAGVGRTQYRPAIDYGRCCWCALCVDVCTTNSLNMTREYIHIDTKTDSFFVLPDEKGIHQTEFPKGWQADKDINFLDLKRVGMGELSLEERQGSFLEIVKGFSKEQARQEASRCVACGLCTAACPAEMNIPEYIDAIWRGDLSEAGRQIYKTNPLPDVCGRICTHKCETACSMGVRGEPVSIRWLKRYAMDNIPAEEYRTLLDQRVVEQRNRAIAVVGGGPSGLSAAYYLVLMGYKVTIFEEFPKAGGMMRYGIPEYRMPYEALDKDIDFILSLGVELKVNTRVGSDISLESLHESYDAVLIATGFHQGRSTRVTGTDHRMVFQAIDLLARITKGEEFPLERKLVVIGGGNVAMDIARSLARKQRERYGAVDVTVTSLETRDIMPADEEEIVESTEEGIVFHPGRGPEEIIIEDDTIVGLKTSRCTRVFDDQGRFSPEFDKTDIEVYEGSMVVEAIGQAPDMSYLGRFADELAYSGRRIKVDEYYRSSLPWLFVIGDIIKGPDVINGIATGHNAAVGVDFFLRPREPGEIKQIDDVLRIAYTFQEELVVRLGEARAVAARLSRVGAPQGAGSKEVRSSADEGVSVVDELDRLLAGERQSLEMVGALLTNPHARIHLRQEVLRTVRKADFGRFTEVEAIAAGSLDEIVNDVADRLRLAYDLYNDILRLTKVKEVEFTVETLRDRHEAAGRAVKEYHVG